MVPISPMPAVIAVQIRKIISRFEQHGAVSPGQARSLEELGLSDRLIFRRLVRNGVIVEVLPGRYYMNLEKLDEFNAMRRKKIAIVLGLIIIGTLIFLLFQNRI